MLSEERRIYVIEHKKKKKQPQSLIWFDIAFILYLY